MVLSYLPGASLVPRKLSNESFPASLVLRNPVLRGPLEEKSALRGLPRCPRTSAGPRLKGTSFTVSAQPGLQLS